MDIKRLSERSRLQRLIEEHPDDVEARKGLARIFLEAGDRRRAATELMSIVRLHLGTGVHNEALKACRAALQIDPDNLELRLLLAQVYARFPDPAAARVAEPVDVVELSPTQRLEEVDILEEIDAPPLAGSPREEITRPPLPIAARAPSSRDDDAGPDTLEVGRPSPVYDHGDVPARPSGGADGWPAPESLATSGAWRDEELEETMRVELSEVRGGEWGSRDTSPGGHEATAERAFDRRRPAAVRASARGAAARLPLGPALDSVDADSLSGNSILGPLDAARRRALLAGGQVVGYPDAAPIVTAGKAVDSLVFLVDGAARVHDGSDPPPAPAFSERGQLIADFEVLAASTPRCTVTAAGPARTVEVPVSAVAGLRDADILVRDVLNMALRGRVVDDLLARAPVFSTLTAEQKKELSSRFFAVDVEAGEMVIQRGHINRRLLVVLDGQLVVDGRGGAKTFGRMTLHAGDFFGFVATILGRPAQVTVLAATRATLLVLGEQDVYRLVASHKGVARAARKEAVERNDAPISVLAVAGLGGPLHRVPT